MKTVTENSRQPIGRVAYLLGQYPAINATYLLREVRRLRALGFEFPVVSISAPDRAFEQLSAEEQEEMKTTYFIKPLGWRGALWPHLATACARPLAYLRGLAAALSFGGFDLKKATRGCYYFAEAVMVGHWMKRQEISHLHVHFSSTVGWLATRVFPITLSLTMHGPDEFEDPRGYRLAEKIQASLFICAISNYARSQLMKASDHTQWEKFEVSPLGIDPSVFAPRPFRPTPDPFEVICVGRLAPVKAQHILIAAIDRLVQAGKNVRLRLVGGGPDRESLEQAVAARGLGRHVIFEGWVNPDRVQSLYQQADIFALASFAEGVPVVLMEAMAMEIPCVATRITGVPELIQDGVNGLLVAPSDETEMADAIALLMDNAELRHRLGQAGRKRVIEKYDLARNTERLAEIFRRRIGALPQAELQRAARLADELQRGTASMAAPR